ncbi:sulfite exporter TauE/SafE family protein, partial [Halobacteriales archaeon QH_8_64_26]
TVQGAIAVPLVFVVAGAYLLGAVGGWRLAKHIGPSRLVVLLGAMLIGLMPALVYRSLSM